MGDRLLIAEHLRGKQEAMDEQGGELLSLHFEVLSHLHDVDFRVEEALFSRGRGRALGLGQLGKASVMPQTYALFHNYPNPFNPSTTLSFAIPPLVGEGLRAGGDLVIYNVLGQAIRRWDLGRMEPGFHALVWDGRDGSGRASASGVYLVRLQAGSFSQSRKIILLR